MNSLERLKIVMEESGVTQSKLARKVNISDANLSMKFSSAKEVSADFAIRILKVFPDLNLNWLYLGEGAKYKGMEVEDLKREIMNLRQLLDEKIKEYQVLDEKVHLYKRIIDEMDKRSVEGYLKKS